MFNQGSQPLPFFTGEEAPKPKLNNKIRFLRSAGNWSEIAIATASSEVFALLARTIPAMQPAYWLISTGVVIVLGARVSQRRQSRLFVGVLIGAGLGWADAVIQLVAYWWAVFMAFVAGAIALAIFALLIYFKGKQDKRSESNIGFNIGGFDQ